MKLTATGTGIQDSYTMIQKIVVQTGPMVIEAEDMVLDGYIIDQNQHINGQGIAVDPNKPVPSVGKASYVFDGPSGTYTIKLYTTPENDGASGLKLLVGGTQILDVIMPIDASYYNLSYREIYEIKNIQLNNGETILIEGTSATDGQVNHASFARVDKIAFYLESGINAINQRELLKLSSYQPYFSIGPNPMIGDISFNFVTPQNAVLRIYNGAGNLVYQGETVHGSSLKWDGTNLNGKLVERGILFYEIGLGIKIYSGRIVKIK